MSKKLNHSLAIGILQIGILLSFISEGFSQTTNYTWNNSTNLWSTSTAWTPTGGPQLATSTANTNVAVFAATGVGNNTVLLGSDRTVYGLIFTNGANAYTFGSVSAPKALDIMSAGLGLQNVSGQNQIFNLTVNNNDNGATWTTGAGSTTTFNSGLNLTTAGSSASRTLTLGGAGTWNVASAIANGGTATAGIVNVTATGTTTFSGNNTYDGRTTMNAAGGTLTLSGDNSGAAGGVTLTAGTLNINNNNALGTGALNLAGTGATINNTSGASVVNAGNQAWTWTDGLAFGASGNTAANNLNLGTGVVTASSSRTIALAGTGTKLTIGAVNITSTSSGRTITANGAGNTLEMGGVTLSASATPVTVTLAGTANLGVTGAIVNGTTAGNGLTVTASGTTTLSGNNTYTGLTTMNAAGGTLNLRGNNSSATGGTTLTTGTLNINNANALSTGLLELSAVTGTAYGSSIINNTSGGALTFSGLSGVKWSGVALTSGTNSGIQFGTSASTSANNMDFGTGLVTASTDRAMNIAGTGVTISMGTLTTSGTAASYDYQIDGAGNTLDLDGWRISGAATPTQAAQHKIKGSANVNIGAIENGTGSFVNGVGFNSSGVIRLTGNNTYTGDTEFVGSGTNIISGNNSAAVGNVKIAGGTGTGKKPVVRLNSANAISSSSSLLGASSVEQVGTLEIGVASDIVLNSFGTATIEGNNMIFINSSSTQRSLTFTNANNYITLSSGTAGSKKLDNQSANLNVRFNGNIDIGSSTNNAVTFTGAGNFRVDGAVTNGSSTGVRGLTKTGAGTLTLAGAGNNYNGATTVDVGTLLLTNSATLTGSTALTVSTSNTVSSSSSTRTAAATLNVASGSSLLSGSTTTVYSGGNLIMNGTAGSVIVETNGWVGGSGTFSGAVTLKSGSLLNPGNSPGTLNANSAIVLGNSTYNWQISNSGVGTTAGTDWDLLNVTTLLNMSAITGTGTDKWNLVVTADGAFTGWTNNNSPYEYIFAQAANLSLASGFSTLAGTDVTSLFNITTSGITSLPNASFNPNGDFKVMVGTGTDANGGSITTLSLMAVPEPSTGSMLGLGFAGLVVTRLLRRKIS